MRAIHKVMDGNGDGSVSLDEGLEYVKGHRGAMFVKNAMSIMQNMDTDKDGHLSASEFKADLEHFSLDEDEKEMLEGLFPSYDDDADELLSLPEASALYLWTFRTRKLDTDGDGKISLKEFQKVAESKLQGKSPQARKESKAEGRSLFKKLDLDGDKQLSPRESYAYESGVFAGQEAMRKLFEIADADGNKILVVDELLAMRTNPKLGGTSAFYHMRDWIKQEGLEEKRDEL